MFSKQGIKKLRGACRKLVNDKFFSILVFILIFLSVATIIIELSFFSHSDYTWIHRVNDFFFYIFAVELAIRFIACWNVRQFFHEYWIDIVAIIPMIPALRFLRVFRLLRLLRIMSLMVLIRRHVRAFSYFFKKNILEYLLLLTTISFVAVFSSLAMLHFEQPDSTSYNPASVLGSFWVIVYSLFSGQYSTEVPGSLGGKLVIILIMFCNMSLFALLTGTVSTIMMERLKEGTILGKLNFHDMEHHVIICGWTDQAHRIISELQADPEYKHRNFIIIAELPELPDMSSKGVDMMGLHLVNRDFTSAETLKFVNITNASTALILADTSKNRPSHDTDARTVLAALTIEKMNPTIHTCAELIHSENEPHLAMSHVESIVLTRKLSALMLTQAAMKECILPFYSELVHPSVGNTVFEVPFPAGHINQPFDDLIGFWKKEHKALLVGVMQKDGEVKINPEEYMVREKDKAIVIAAKKPKIPKS